ncbi:non-ribosomal peptide synthetase [Paenibacillus sp. GbtcB18]|uniref:non-ribosomal peptide synthetase n=1 Tax=Paenibacillus sp. GbtcB18 TaxID=2824763 RepID=UPI001C30E611|nr:non-ribosomal peptide synthetase [Paenibacillus sp. GbtcB18]
MSQVKIKDIYPLSPMQEGMLYHSMLDRDSEVYFQQNIITVGEVLDRELVQQSLQLLIERYDIFRTVFVYKETERPLQVVLQEREAPSVHTEDVSGLSEDRKTAALEQFTGSDRANGFDLEKDVPLRLALFKWSETTCKLVWSFPHIVMDGWCLGIVANDFFSLYTSLRDGIRASLEPVYPFSSFIQWLENQNREEAAAYWSKYLDGLENETTVPGFNRAEGSTPFRLEHHSLKLNAALTQKMEQIAKRRQVTVSTVFQTAWGVLLQGYNNSTDVVFGTVVSGRPEEIKGIENMVGLFINTIPLRVSGEKSESFAALLSRVQSEWMESNAHSYLSLADIQAQSQLKHNLIRHLVVFENYPISEELIGTGDETGGGPRAEGEPAKNSLRITEVDGFEQTNYELTLTVIPGRELEIKFSFNAENVELAGIRAIAGHLHEVLEQITETPDIPLDSINLLTDEERSQLRGFNDTGASYPAEKTMHGWFELQAAMTPEKIAVIFGEKRLTYRELNVRANRLARQLRLKGVEPDAVVGILCERSIELMVGLLAILKAGGAYLPIDPGHPQERIDYMLADSGAALVLAQKELLERAPAGAETVELDAENILTGDGSNLSRGSGPEHLAYVIYTSGTTGNPKGVMIEHRALINRLHWMQKRYPLDEKDVILQKTPYSFDVSVWELFWWGAYGAKVVFLEPGAEKDPAQIARAIDKYNVTTMHFVPSMLSVFLEHAESRLEPGALASLRYVFASGEALNPQQANRFNSLFYRTNGTRLINLYGPTEATIDVSYFDCSFGKDPLDRVPIGKPIDNIRLYITDNSGRLQPVGVAGELCIAGTGLARGYLNRPELTAEKFAATSFDPSGRIYKTGDLARWLPDGNIEYLGRLDHQVKIRGYRIELGEIEAALLRHPMVKEALVMDRTDGQGQKVLCAYLVCGPDPAPETVLLRESLAVKLPGYMIPSYFVFLPEMPLTSNGKVNRRALPAPDTAWDESGYIRPEGETEEALAAIWKEVLGLEHLGAGDSFFDRGGHSLKAALLVSKIHQRLQVDLPLRQVFESPTIRTMAEAIRKEAYSAHQAIEPAEPRDVYPVTSAQKRLMVLDQLEQESTAYHIPHVLISRVPLDRRRLQTVFEKLIARHEPLRTSFEQIESEIVQRSHPEVVFEVEEVTLSGAEAPSLTELGERAEIKEKSGIEEIPAFSGLSAVLKSDEGIVPENTDVNRASGYPEEPTAVQDILTPAEKEALDRVIEGFIRPFTLGEAPLIRVGAADLTCGGTALLIDLHHIIADGVSMAVIANEFNRLYAGEELAPLKIQYKDYAVWQQKRSSSGVLDAQEAYWTEKLSGELPVLNFPTDYMRPPLQSFEGDRYVFTLGSSEVTALKQAASRAGATLYMVLLASFNTLLHRYTGQEDIIVGSPVAGRTHADLQPLIGMFVNTLPMRSFPAGDKTFGQLLEEVKRTALEGFQNQEIPLETILDKLSLKRDLSRNPLFDMLFIFQNLGIEEIGQQGELFQSYEFGLAVSKLDLTLQAEENATGGIDFHFEYATGLFRKETIQRLASHYVRILEAAVRNPDIKLSAIDMLEEQERRMLVESFNDTAAAFAYDKTIHQQFEEQAALTPDAPALVFGDQVFTYRQLNEKANSLARTLQSHGVGPDRLVGLLTERSPSMMIGLLAVLKAGGAYVPIDPDFPAARVAYMLEDSEARVLLTEGALTEGLQTAGAVISLDDEGVYSGETGNLEPASEPHHLAYVIYTSGSTGNPKGVMLQHRSVSNFFTGMREKIEFVPGRKILALTTVSFDIFVLETLLPLTCGMSVVLAETLHQTEPGALSGLISAHGMDTLQITPSRLQMLLGSPEGASSLQNVRNILVGGEAMPVALLRSLQEFPGLNIFNMYGPTETTVWSAVQNLTRADSIDIGRPIANTQIYIVDAGGKLQPAGVPGELCIAGEGLARGYWNRPDLTEEKFVPCTFGKGGGRMYKTGDLARWLPDGSLEFLGRLDHQVKVRGYRIELGEIETALVRHEAVEEAVVLAREDASGGHTLTGYLVVKTEIPASEIRFFLGQSLPDYMIPAAFAQLEKFPLTPNGKTDRKALLGLDAVQTSAAVYVAPGDEIEEQLAAMWAGILSAARVGVHDNFFELGGHSLKASLFVAQVREQWGVELELRQLFRQPTIAEIAEHLRQELDEIRRLEEILREIEALEQV